MEWWVFNYQMYDMDKIDVNLKPPVSLWCDRESMMRRDQGNQQQPRSF